MAGRMRHIPTGRTHARTPVILLVQDLEVRVINAATGELLRELTIDLTRDYQPLRRPPGPTPERPRANPHPEGSPYADVLRHHICSGGRI